MANNVRQIAPGMLLITPNGAAAAAAPEDMARDAFAAVQAAMAQPVADDAMARAVIAAIRADAAQPIAAQPIAAQPVAPAAAPAAAPDVPPVVTVGYGIAYEEFVALYEQYYEPTPNQEAEIRQRASTLYATAIDSGAMTVEAAVKAMTTGFNPFAPFQTGADRPACSFKSAPGIIAFQGLGENMCEGTGAHVVMITAADSGVPTVFELLGYRPKNDVESQLDAYEQSYRAFIKEMAARPPAWFPKVADPDAVILGFHVQPTISRCLHAHGMPVGVPLTATGRDLEYKWVSFDVVRRFNAAR